jgi:hypothetical protein
VRVLFADRFVDSGNRVMMVHGEVDKPIRWMRQPATRGSICARPSPLCGRDRSALGLAFWLVMEEQAGATFNRSIRIPLLTKRTMMTSDALHSPSVFVW